MLKFSMSIFLLALSSVVPQYSHAASDAGLQTVVQTVEKSYDQLLDLHAEFAQKTTLPAVNRVERGAGELFLKKQTKGAAMFRFDYRKPNQHFVSNGKTLWYYQPEINQVIVTDVASMFEGGRGLAFNYLTGMGDLSRDFTIRFAQPPADKNGNHMLDLNPKKGSQAVSRLQLTVDAKAVERVSATGKVEAQFPVLSLTVVDPAGGKTTMEFSKVRVNRGIGSERFNFKIPKGAEVIRN